MLSFPMGNDDRTPGYPDIHQVGGKASEYDYSDRVDE